MYSEDDFHYAFETTRVLYEPDRRIDTFGSTAFDFTLITELMDSVNQVRIREGRINAERPQILRPDGSFNFELEGFSEEAEAFSNWLQEHAHQFAFLRYGFSFSRSNISESIVHDSLEEVSDRVTERAKNANNPMAAVISGSDDAWEFCLLRFTVEMIQKSIDINHFDLRRRGLL